MFFKGDQVLPNHCLSRFAAILTGKGNISDFNFPDHQRVLKIFASFISGFNDAQFHGSLPWRNLVNMPPVLVRSEMIQSSILKSAVNNLIGRSSSSREASDATTVTGLT